MSRWKEGGQRRSPRLSAFGDEWKAVQQPRRVSRNLKEMPYQPQGPASRTRASKKRKLRPLKDDECEQSDEDHPFSINQQTGWDHTCSAFEDQDALTRPSTQSMPDKRILEIVVDTLQRRDTNELFAQPVDPQEVEDYYDIIEEPMDFGTMRAKLHEGMYKSLEQFEHDALLIPRNAMHFNSSTTIYFRQARAIHELAKRVFHTLKTDPERFEIEFSGTRRRTRRIISESRVPLRSSSSKLATNIRTGRSNDASSKEAPHVRASSSNQRKSIGGSPGFHNKANINARDNTFPSEADPRSTYWTSFLTKKDSIFSMVEQQDFDYRDSLMMFVKDLGLTARMVAERKLAQCLVSASNYHTPVSKCLFPEPKLHCRGQSIRTQRELTFPDKGITTTSHSLPNHLHGSPTFIENHKYADKRRGVSSVSASFQMEKSKNDNQARELKPWPEKSSDFRLRSDYQSLCSWPPKPVATQIMGLTRNPSLPSLPSTAHHRTNGSAEVDVEAKPSQGVQLGSSSYIFDLPFLKTKLNQLNALGNKDKLLQQGGSGADDTFKEGFSRTFGDNFGMEQNTRICNDVYHQFLLDPRRRDLVLQL